MILLFVTKSSKVFYNISDNLYIFFEDIFILQGPLYFRIFVVNCMLHGRRKSLVFEP